MGPADVKGQKGTRGQKGIRGETGAQLPAKKDQKGVLRPMPFKNWKECVWKNLNDNKDDGLIKASTLDHYFIAIIVCLNFLHNLFNINS